MRFTYSLAEAAAMIPCSERWLADRLRNGTFTGRKISGSWRLTRSDIEAIVEASKGEPTEPAAPPPLSFSKGSVRAKRRAGM